MIIIIFCILMNSVMVQLSDRIKLSGVNNLANGNFFSCSKVEEFLLVYNSKHMQIDGSIDLVKNYD